MSSKWNVSQRDEERLFISRKKNKKYQNSLKKSLWKIASEDCLWRSNICFRKRDRIARFVFEEKETPFGRTFLTGLIEINRIDPWSDSWDDSRSPEAKGTLLWSQSRVRTTMILQVMVIDIESYHGRRKRIVRRLRGRGSQGRSSRRIVFRRRCWRSSSRKHLLISKWWCNIIWRRRSWAWSFLWVVLTLRQIKGFELRFVVACITTWRWLTGIFINILMIIVWMDGVLGIIVVLVGVVASKEKVIPIDFRNQNVHGRGMVVWTRVTWPFTGHGFSVIETKPLDWSSINVFIAFIIIILNQKWVILFWDHVIIVGIVDHIIWRFCIFIVFIVVVDTDVSGFEVLPLVSSTVDRLGRSVVIVVGGNTDVGRSVQDTLGREFNTTVKIESESIEGSIRRSVVHHGECFDEVNQSKDTMRRSFFASRSTSQFPRDFFARLTSATKSLGVDCVAQTRRWREREKKTSLRKENLSSMNRKTLNEKNLSAQFPSLSLFSNSDLLMQHKIILEWRVEHQHHHFYVHFCTQTRKQVLAL